MAPTSQAPTSQAPTSQAPTSQAAPAIAARHLTKVFTDFWRRPTVTAVDDVSFAVEAGEVFGLLGPNGSGKSTTIKLLLGLLFPTRGAALVLGGAPHETAVRARIGFLPEESYVYPFLTAGEALDHYGRLFGLGPIERASRTTALLAMVGLEAARDRRVGEMSKGMRRRVGLCQALLNDPDVLILDEPTSGLDPIGTRWVKDVILALKARGKTVLLTSHLLADTSDLCDRVAILYGGKIHAEGRVADLVEASGATRIETSALGDEQLVALRAWLAAQGAEVHHVGTPRRSLEAVFLDVVREAEASGAVTGGALGTGRLAAFLTAQSPLRPKRGQLAPRPTQERPTTGVGPKPAPGSAQPARAPARRSRAKPAGETVGRGGEPPATEPEAARGSTLLHSLTLARREANSASGAARPNRARPDRATDFRGADRSLLTSLLPTSRGTSKVAGKVPPASGDAVAKLDADRLANADSQAHADHELLAGLVRGGIVR